MYSPYQDFAKIIHRTVPPDPFSSANERHPEKSEILDDYIAVTDQCMSDYDLERWKKSSWLWVR
ncbi:MAG TPA: hypothetical protein VHS29_13775 [Candidatus Acidoferrales bacterium]|jgi:hypothetical protein|nr:hypothetical protein [Candidatus Acidoferrales bacterium]